jgi:hypothetical protein
MLTPGERVAVRRKPSEDNAMAVRFRAHRARVAPPQPYKTAIAKALAAIGWPAVIDERGRLLGDVLLALEEARSLR